MSNISKFHKKIRTSILLASGGLMLMEAIKMSKELLIEAIQKSRKKLMEATKVGKEIQMETLVSKKEPKGAMKMRRRWELIVLLYLMICKTAVRR
jgi:predicted ABC-type ATPase